MLVGTGLPITHSQKSGSAFSSVFLIYCPFAFPAALGHATFIMLDPGCLFPGWTRLAIILGLVDAFASNHYWGGLYWVSGVSIRDSFERPLEMALVIACMIVIYVFVFAAIRLLVRRFSRLPEQ